MSNDDQAKKNEPEKKKDEPEKKKDEPEKDDAPKVLFLRRDTGSKKQNKFRMSRADNPVFSPTKKSTFQGSGEPRKWYQNLNRSTTTVPVYLNDAESEVLTENVKQANEVKPEVLTENAEQANDAETQVLTEGVQQTNDAETQVLTEKVEQLSVQETEDDDAFGNEPTSEIKKQRTQSASQFKSPQVVSKERRPTVGTHENAKVRKYSFVGPQPGLKLAYAEELVELVFKINVVTLKSSSGLVMQVTYNDIYAILCDALAGNSFILDVESGANELFERFTKIGEWTTPGQTEPPCVFCVRGFRFFRYCSTLTLRGSLCSTNMIKLLYATNNRALVTVNVRHIVLHSDQVLTKCYCLTEFITAIPDNVAYLRMDLRNTHYKGPQSMINTLQYVYKNRNARFGFVELATTDLCDIEYFKKEVLTENLAFMNPDDGIFKLVADSSLTDAHTALKDLCKEDKMILKGQTIYHDAGSDVRTSFYNWYTSKSGGTVLLLKQLVDLKARSNTMRDDLDAFPDDWTSIKR